MKTKRKQAPKMAPLSQDCDLPILYSRPSIAGDDGILRCGNCLVEFVITSSGVICDCPRIQMHPYSYSDLRSKYPQQISESPADRATGGGA